MDDQNLYLGPDAEVSEFSSGDELAGRGARLGAAIIDAIILMLILGPLTYMGGYWQAAMEAGQAGGQLPFGTTLMWAVIGFVVFAIVQAFPLDASGQTWGKKLLKIKIVDLDGGQPTLGRRLGMRYLPVPAIGVIPPPGPMNQ